MHEECARRVCEKCAYVYVCVGGGQTASVLVHLNPGNRNCPHAIHTHKILSCPLRIPYITMTLHIVEISECGTRAHTHTHTHTQQQKSEDNQETYTNS